MPSSTARMATERAGEYLRQLCEHFADAGQRHSPQEFEVTFDDSTGFINFAPIISGTCRLDARQEDMLVVEVGADNEPELARVRRIVAKHLERLGRDAGLTIEWSPAEGPRLP
jgi:hypothetical protein